MRWHHASDAGDVFFPGPSRMKFSRQRSRWLLRPDLLGGAQQGQRGAGPMYSVAGQESMCGAQQ